jgi:hypothetical protein
LALLASNRSFGPLQTLHAIMAQRQARIGAEFPRKDSGPKISKKWEPFDFTSEPLVKMTSAMTCHFLHFFDVTKFFYLLFQKGKTRVTKPYDADPLLTRLPRDP